MKSRVLELLETTRNPYEIKLKTGARLSEIRNHMGDLPYLKGWGKPTVQRYIISRRKVFQHQWPASDREVIEENKRLFDQGRVIMCQKQDSGYIIQYAFPVRGKPIKRQAYFFGG